mmetsp:Transcript_5104/g.19144  ORF Transcript_5104/g.19144 Transcript_5104/m.19144 type:complete len:662 (-) Transcript_5104:37-2022(-)
MFPSINQNNHSYSESHPNATPSTPASATTPSPIGSFSNHMGLNLAAAAASGKKSSAGNTHQADSTTSRSAAPSPVSQTSKSHHHFGAASSASSSVGGTPPSAATTMARERHRLKRKNSKQLLMQRKHQALSNTPSRINGHTSSNSPAGYSSTSSPIVSHRQSSQVGVNALNGLASHLDPSSPQRVTPGSASSSNSTDLNHIHTLQEQVKQQNNLLEKITASCYKELQQMKQKFSSKTKKMDSCIFAWGIVTKIEFTKSFHLLVKKYEKTIREMKKQHDMEKREIQLQWEEKFFLFRQNLQKQHNNLMTDIEKSNSEWERRQSTPSSLIQTTTGNPYALLKSNSFGAGNSEYDDIRELKMQISKLTRELQHSQKMNEELRNELKLQYEEKKDLEQENLKIMRDCERTVSKIEQKHESVWEYEAEITGLSEKNSFFMSELQRKQFQVRILTRKLLNLGMISEDEYHSFLRADSFSFAADRERAAMKNYTDDLPEITKELAVCCVQTNESSLMDEEPTTSVAQQKHKSKKRNQSTKPLHKLNKDPTEDLIQKQKEIKACQSAMGKFDSTAFRQLRGLIRDNKENFPLQEKITNPTIQMMWDLSVKLCEVDDDPGSGDDDATPSLTLNDSISGQTPSLNAHTLSFPAPKISNASRQVSRKRGKRR